MYWKLKTKLNTKSKNNFVGYCWLLLLLVFEKCCNRVTPLLPAWPLFSTAFVNILRAAITFLAKFLKYPAHFQLRTHCKTSQHYIITHTTHSSERLRIKSLFNSIILITKTCFNKLGLYIERAIAISAKVQYE